MGTCSVCLSPQHFSHLGRFPSCLAWTPSLQLLLLNWAYRLRVGRRPPSSCVVSAGEKLCSAEKHPKWPTCLWMPAAAQHGRGCSWGRHSATDSLVKPVPPSTWGGQAERSHCTHWRAYLVSNGGKFHGGGTQGASSAHQPLWWALWAKDYKRLL